MRKFEQSLSLSVMTFLPGEAERFPPPSPPFPVLDVWDEDLLPPFPSPPFLPPPGLPLPLASLGGGVLARAGVFLGARAVVTPCEADLRNAVFVLASALTFRCGVACKSW